MGTTPIAGAVNMKNITSFLHNVSFYQRGGLLVKNGKINNKSLSKVSDLRGIFLVSVRYTFSLDWHWGQNSLLVLK